MKEITKEKIDRYMEITTAALREAENSNNRIRSLAKEREEFLDMIKRYIADAKHFELEGELVDAFAAINYAHGWLDAGASLGLFDVHNSKLFTVDD